MIMRCGKSHTSASTPSALMRCWHSQDRASTPSVLRNEEGQWIILAGFAISVSLAVLIVLLNLSFMSGHQSSQSEIDFPITELRELYDETYREVNTVVMQENETDMINNTMVNFGNLLSQLYSYHGQLVTTSVNATTNYSETEYLNITTVEVFLAFDDGVTEYREHLNITSTMT